MSVFKRLRSALHLAHERVIDVLCPVVQSIEGGLQKVDYRAAASKAAAIFTTGGGIAAALKDVDVFVFVMLLSVSSFAFWLDLMQRKRMGVPRAQQTDQPATPAPGDAPAPPTTPTEGPTP